MWFADGTGNDPDSRTHVHYLWSAAVEAGKANPAIVSEYDKGVGVWRRKSWLLKRLPHLIGLAFGFGISKNIRDGYRFLATNYAHGDRIYLFGFSRGAYTVRSLANFIDFCGGLLRRPTSGFGRSFSVGLLYNLYRFRKLLPDAACGWLLRRLRTSLAISRCPIDAIAVWDTVGSVLFPFAWHAYHMDGLAENTKLALHAIALDERRGPYRVVRFVDEHETIEPDADGNPRLKEVWFPGAHSDIGGGYDDRKPFSYLSLAWMLEQLPDSFPLKFVRASIQPALDQPHQSDVWYWTWFEPRTPFRRDAVHCSVMSLTKKSAYMPLPFRRNGWLPEKARLQLQLVHDANRQLCACDDGAA